MNGVRHDLSWRERARRRGAGVALFRPPEAELRERRWHVIDTHLGRRRMQWRPGIDVWHNAEGQRWTAESAAEFGWHYVGVAPDQSGGRA
jgi:hypothetical protein